MAFALVNVYHGPCLTFHTMEHKPQKLAGLRNQLMNLGYKVALIPVDHVNYCMLEMCGHEVFRCNLINLQFNTHYSRDPVCQRAVEAVVESSAKFQQARNHLWFWTYLNNQIFKRGPYSPLDYWPQDVQIAKPCIPCWLCADCCKVSIQKKDQPLPDKE